MVRVYVVGYASMVYLSATVVQGSGGRVLLPWEIVQCHSEAITIRHFFVTILLPKLGLSEFAGEPEVKIRVVYMHDTCIEL